MRFAPRCRAAIGLVVLLTAGACRSFPPPPDHSDLDVSAARDFVRAQALALKSLEAQVSLSIETPDFSGALEGALVVEPPGRMRLRTSKMMQDVFDLVVTPDALELWWFPDRVLYRKTPDANAANSANSANSASDANAAKEQDARALSFLRTLDPGSLRASLNTFELPQADATPASPWQARSVGERIERTARSLVVTTLLEAGGHLTREFDGATLLLRQVTVTRSDGSTMLITTYDDYRPVGPLWLPETTTLEDHRFGVTFTMTFSDMVVNEGILPGAFELEVPAGARICELR
jgi:hypothetical protein